MAVVISDSRNANYDGYMNTPNAYYRVEASNLATFSSRQSLTSTFNLSVTFANAGNCMGIVVPLTSVSSCNRPLTVTLQENVASVWTDRATTTYTASQIMGTTTYSAVGTGLITPMKFAFPYAVDTTAGKWRFQFTSSAGTGNWDLHQAAASTPSFATWCNNAVSFTSGTDQMIVMDEIQAGDASCTIMGATQTGNTVNSIAGWICSGSRTPYDMAKLKWDPFGASPTTLTINGLMLMGPMSAFRAGTDGDRIPNAAMGTLEFTDATAGTETAVTSSGFRNPAGENASSIGGIYIYGEIPAVEDTELSVAAAAGQPVVTTKVSTGWANGDKVVIGRQTTRGNSDATIYTVSSVVGTTVTLTTNLAVGRAINASIFRMNKYGFKIRSSNSTGTRMNNLGTHNMQMSGCESESISFYNAATYQFGYTSSDEPWLNEHMSITNPSTSSIAFYIGALATPGAGHTMDHLNCFKSVPCTSFFQTNGQGTLVMTNNIMINMDASGGTNQITLSGRWTFNDNKFENQATTTAAGVVAAGVLNSFRRNKFYGLQSNGGSQVGAARMNGLYSTTDWGNNTYDNCHTGVCVSSSVNIGVVATADEFAQAEANTIDVYEGFNGFNDVLFDNCKGNITTQHSSPMQPGSRIALSKVNQVEGNDRVEFEEGTIYKAGTGLSDTTVHTGPYCMKWVPRAASTFTMQTVTKIPTENIQSQTMSVGIWCKIANAAYYAGTHQKPRLSIKYDNTTTVSVDAAATTDWQYLQVSFTPTTTYGELVMTLSAKTDASVANAAFYFADISVLYPAGHTIALGAMGTWSSAIPTNPPISTSVSAADVWAANPSGFGANTVGDKVNKIKQDTALIPAGL